MEPRISKPEKGNKYYINKSDGGYSLPNCVAIYGWFNEIGGKGQVYLNKPWYPWSVIQAAKREGLEVTKEPTKGGIMVWKGGYTGEGHVAGVCKVISATEVQTAESEYYGKDWKNFKRKIGDGNWRDGCSWMGSNYTYQGCIKNTFVKEEEDLTKAETEKLIKEMFPEQFKTAMREYLEYQANRTDTWAATRPSAFVRSSTDVADR